LIATLEDELEEGIEIHTAVPGFRSSLQKTHMIIPMTPFVFPKAKRGSPSPSLGGSRGGGGGADWGLWMMIAASQRRPIRPLTVHSQMHERTRSPIHLRDLFYFWKFISFFLVPVEPADRAVGGEDRRSMQLLVGRGNHARDLKVSPTRPHAVQHRQGTSASAQGKTTIQAVWTVMLYELTRRCSTSSPRKTTLRLRPVWTISNPPAR
jgi:hypothetical protein